MRRGAATSTDLGRSRHGDDDGGGAPGTGWAGAHVPEVLSARFERPSPRHLITEHAMALGAMLNTAQSLQSVEMLA